LDSESTEGYEIRFQKPKILLLDLHNEILDALQSAGFNTISGSFGKEYNVKQSDNFIPVIPNDLPRYSNEREIIIINLANVDTTSKYQNINLVEGQSSFWVNCNSGTITNRPLTMERYKEDLNRILESGGIFIIFADYRKETKYLIGKSIQGKINGKPLKYSNWSFLSIFFPENLSRIEMDSGEEIIVKDTDDDIIHELSTFIKQNLDDTYYLGKIKFFGNLHERWIPFIFNKHGEAIGGLLKPSFRYKGHVLILPQLPINPQFILRLVNELLPKIFPEHFPYSESNWIENDEYDFDSIFELKQKRKKLIEDTSNQIRKIDENILKERTNFEYIYDILTNTGDDLVSSVKKCLELIGFEDIEDVDKEVEKEGKRKREDLRIWDRMPVLLVEVKGLNGHPTDDDVLQAYKYVPRRMQEFKLLDIRAVSVINHFRGKAPILRGGGFSTDQIEDANHNDLTLVTTWDLFLLIKGMIEWDWDPKTIQDLFYIEGRMQRIPTHYKLLGKIENYWKNVGVVGIRITGTDLHNGGRLGYVLPNGFIEEDVKSLQVEKKDVNIAIVGELAGIKTRYPPEQLKKNLKVYLISP
jgi:hypothetical protein